MDSFPKLLHSVMASILKNKSILNYLSKHPTLAFSHRVQINYLKNSIGFHVCASNHAVVPIFIPTITFENLSISHFLVFYFPQISLICRRRCTFNLLATQRRKIITFWYFWQGMLTHWCILLAIFSKNP